MCQTESLVDRSHLCKLAIFPHLGADHIYAIINFHCSFILFFFFLLPAVVLSQSQLFRSGISIVPCRLNPWLDRYASFDSVEVIDKTISVATACLLGYTIMAERCSFFFRAKVASAKCRIFFKMAPAATYLPHVSHSHDASLDIGCVLTQANDVKNIVYGIWADSCGNRQSEGRGGFEKLAFLVSECKLRLAWYR